jgi:hypothetical protein
MWLLTLKIYPSKSIPLDYCLEKIQGSGAIQQGNIQLSKKSLSPTRDEVPYNGTLMWAELPIISWILSDSPSI